MQIIDLFLFTDITLDSLRKGQTISDVTRTLRAGPTDLAIDNNDRTQKREHVPPPPEGFIHCTFSNTVSNTEFCITHSSLSTIMKKFGTEVMIVWIRIPCQKLSILIMQSQVIFYQ